MTLESQVTSLELSRRLAELGIKQESLWYWGRWGKIWELVQTHPNANLDKYSSFTVAELGELLPKNEWTTTGSTSDRWIVEYHDFNSQGKVVEAPTEADARAKMLIYLIENKLISV